MLTVPEEEEEEEEEEEGALMLFLLRYSGRSLNLSSNQLVHKYVKHYVTFNITRGPICTLDVLSVRYRD
jgi:hypothetical protein